MRLAIVTPSVILNDGQGRVNYEIVRHALQEGVQVHLFANKVAPELEAQGAVWTPLQPGFKSWNILAVYKFVRMADKALVAHQGQFDIIHAYGYSLTRAHHINTAQFVHGAWARSPVHTSRLRRDFYGAYQWLDSWCNARWEKQSFKRARVVVACSDLVREELKSIGVNAKRIRVIDNAADPQEFSPGEVDRAAWNLPPDVPMGLFVGDIRTPRKNLDSVLKALVEVPTLHLAVVGDVERSPYPKLAEKLGIEARVHFLGFRRDIALIMRACDVFVFPSRYEPFGIVILEAMLSGLPVITCKSVGASSLVSPECGIVIPEADDVESLALAMRDLADDAPRRAAMGREGRKVAESHSWQNMARAYLDLYHEFARGEVVAKP